MIRTTTVRGEDAVKVTFALPLDQAPGPVSVVGDFNDWDPHADPMRKRSNQTRSAVVRLPAGAEFEFRYLAEGGAWLHEPDAERRGDNNVLRT